MLLLLLVLLLLLLLVMVRSAQSGATACAPQKVLTENIIDGCIAV
jgi:hypothetical protein